MDVASDDKGLAPGTVLLRGIGFFGWFLLFLALMWVVGLLIAIPLVTLAYMRIAGRESWALSLPYAVVLTVLIYLIFDRILHVPWPPALMGNWLPAYRSLFS